MIKLTFTINVIGGEFTVDCNVNQKHPNKFEEHAAELINSEVKAIFDAITCRDKFTASNN